MKRKCKSNFSTKKDIKKEDEIQTKITSNKTSIGPYIFIKEIGKGTFSSVFKVKRLDIPNCYFACKIIEKKGIQASEDAKISFEREIRLNQQLHHPGHVELVDLLKDDENYYMIMQYCPGGSLLNFLRKQKNPIQEFEAKPLFKQIVETVEFLQIMGVSHRDLKPENILFNGYHKLVIADFGFSRFVEFERSNSKQKRRNLVKSRCGSTEYASPEIVSGGKEPYDGFASDIWSCGVILYEMVTKCSPWKLSKNTSEIIQQIINCEYKIPTNLSDSCQNLLKKMMEPDPNKRITISEILEHDWLKNVPKQFDISNETVYNSISLKMVDRFFEIDNIFEELSTIQFNGFYRSLSKKNILFEQQCHELTKSFNNEIQHHTPKGLKRYSKIKIAKPPCINTQKFIDSQYSQPYGTPSSKKSQNSPSGNQISIQNMNSSLLGIEKVHIVKPPESSKLHGIRGRHNHKLVPLKIEPKLPTESISKDLHKNSIDNTVLIPHPPLNSPKSPKNYQRPIKRSARNYISKNIYV